MKNFSHFWGSRQKNVIYGKIVPQKGHRDLKKSASRSQTCQQVYWVHHSHNIIIKVVLGRYIVTLNT